jgi:hypothetical protein
MYLVGSWGSARGFHRVKEAEVVHWVGCSRGHHPVMHIVLLRLLGLAGRVKGLRSDLLRWSSLRFLWTDWKP